MVSVLVSGAEGPGFKSQPRRCRVTGSSPLKGGGGNCRPGGKHRQPTADFMTHITGRLTAKNRDQLRNPALVIEYRLPLPFYLYLLTYLLIAILFGLQIISRQQSGVVANPVRPTDATKLGSFVARSRQCERGITLAVAVRCAEALQAYFGRFGDISECMIMRDPVTRRSRYLSLRSTVVTVSHAHTVV